MLTHLDAIQSALTRWREHALDRGWISHRDAERLEAFRLATPGQLFDTPERPLVVGLFGGTGVGKSALLNRLAGDEIARSSAERPTSRNMTAYLHRSVQANRLPPQFPTDRIRMAIHQNDEHARILWLDMPDLDSVEHEHRELVQQWLPYIDVILYVLSPDRYRDDVGWRLMLEHRSDHAWVFVFNQWDRAVPDQLDDLHDMLNRAGLDDPLLYRTDSHPDPDRRVADDFPELVSTLQGLAEQRWIEQLESRGLVKRLRALRQLSDEVRPGLRVNADLSANAEQWHQTFAETVAPPLRERAATRIHTLAAQWPERSASGLTLPLGVPLPGLMKPPAQPDPQSVPRQETAALFDALWLQQLDSALETHVQQLRQQGVPSPVLERHFSALRERLPAELNAQVEEQLGQALALPGTAWQRGLHRGLGLLKTLLPLAALAWVGWRLIGAWQRGAADPAAYLGGNFAIHSLLLLGLAWLIPWFLHRRAEPSRRVAVRRGLNAGLEQALGHAERQFGDALENLAADARSLDSELDQAFKTPSTLADQSLQDALPATLQRMLFDDQAPSMPSTVRATTHNDTTSPPAS